MKPSWSDAPEWAKYLAMDYWGYWFWYSEKPSGAELGWNAANGSRVAQAGSSSADWRDTLEPRPLATST